MTLITYFFTAYIESRDKKWIHMCHVNMIQSLGEFRSSKGGQCYAPDKSLSSEYHALFC